MAKQKTPSKPTIDTSKKDTQQVIKEAYAKVVEIGNYSGLNSSCSCSSGCCSGGCCGGGQDLSKYLGYTDEELQSVADANLGLGCGNPISLGEIKTGQTVVDLGSGAGIDCLLAAKKVGVTGKIIGVDMTEAMIKKARENAIKYHANNVEFRLGDIQKLPVESNSVDIVISNCVINLAPDKQQVLNEAHRVLKSGGSMYVSDVMLLKELSPEQRNDTQLLCACIGGALLRSDYINKLEKAGFTVRIVEEDTDICQKWFGHNQLPIASIKFVATKK